MNNVGALADFVWPALLFASYQRGIPAIVAGLVAELLVLRFVFPMSWKRAAIVDVAMNAASTLVGVIAIPVAGFIWELVMGFTLYRALKIGTFNPFSWAMTCLMAIFISTAVETAVVRYGFKYDITRRRFWAVALANALSTAIAYASMLRHPPQF